MSIRVVAPLVVPPVSITTALRHMRVLANEADTVLLYLLAATELVEDYTGRSLLTKTFVLEIDSWPNYRSFWPTFRSYVPSEVHPLWSSDNLRCIELRRTPLISIDSVKYWGADNVSNTMDIFDTSHYRADATSEPGRIVFVEDGFTLPDVQKRHEAIQIQFRSGYGLRESDIDPVLRLAVMTMAHNFYDNRIPVGDAKMAPLPYSLQHLLRSKRVDSMAPVK